MKLLSCACGSTAKMCWCELGERVIKHIYLGWTQSHKNVKSFNSLLEGNSTAAHFVAVASDTLKYNRAIYNHPPWINRPYYNCGRAEHKFALGFHESHNFLWESKKFRFTIELSGSLSGLQTRFLSHINYQRGWRKILINKTFGGWKMVSWSKWRFIDFSLDVFPCALMVLLWHWSTCWTFVSCLLRRCINRIVHNWIRRLVHVHFSLNELQPGLSLIQGPASAMPHCCKSIVCQSCSKYRAVNVVLWCTT